MAPGLVIPEVPREARAAVGAENGVASCLTSIMQNIRQEERRQTIGARPDAVTERANAGS
jgi:hypothetical protein